MSVATDSVERPGAVPDCRCEECRRRGELEALRECIRVRTAERDALQLAIAARERSVEAQARLIDQLTSDLPPTQTVETEYDHPGGQPTKVTTWYSRPCPTKTPSSG